MPRSVRELVDLLDLEEIEDNLFRGAQPDTQMQRVFGGQVAAHALVAATRTVDPAYVAHSLHSYFLRPGDTKVPIVYDVDDLRDGRSFATRRVVARQHGRPIYFMTANYQRPEDGLEHQDAMPDVPAPEDCKPLGDMYSRRSPRFSEEWEQEWAALDVRWAADTRPDGGLDPTEMPSRVRLWMRINGRLPDEPLVHQGAFTYASDMTLLGSTLIPHRVHVSSPEMQSASLDHTIWFHRPFRTDEWWLYDQHSPFAGGGRGFAIARVFAQDGRLVASVAQEGLIRKRG